MTLYEYLGREYREELPGWLARFGHGAAFPRQEFFRSRIVYYPGSGTDGHPVQLFGSTHSAHCFIYADYGLTRAELEGQLQHPAHGFRGYRTLARIQVSERDLVPDGWTSHVPAHELPPRHLQLAAVAADPFGFLEVLERDDGYGDDHGAHRLAILFLGADGIATYDALFCQGHAPAPYVVVLQDHGLGGGWASFARDGQLERIAKACDVVPPWLLVADGTEPWEGFDRVPGVGGDAGGVHRMLRFLHGRRER